MNQIMVLSIVVPQALRLKNLYFQKIQVQIKNFLIKNENIIF